MSDIQMGKIHVSKNDGGKFTVVPLMHVKDNGKIRLVVNFIASHKEVMDIEKFKRDFEIMSNY